jgi:hypothetical protein
MTGRRTTEAEEARRIKLDQLLEQCSPQYVASSPFLFSSRQQVTAALSRLEMFKLIQSTPGAVIETGVFRGNSLMWMAQVSQVLEPFAINRKFIGFDTFSGFASIDNAADPADVSGETFADVDLGILRSAIEVFDTDRPVNSLPKVELVVGDVSKTSGTYAMENPGLLVAMLILDTDLYAPTLAALRAFVPLMHRGGVIVFDEVGYEFFPGETQALHEFFGPDVPRLQRFPFDAAAGYIVL